MKEQAKYEVEGWTRSTCVGFRTVARPTTVISEAWHQVLDLGASNVWVKVNGVAAYTFDGVRWQKHAGDDRLARAIEQEGA